MYRGIRGAGIRLCSVTVAIALIGLSAACGGGNASPNTETKQIDDSPARTIGGGTNAFTDREGYVQGRENVHREITPYSALEFGIYENDQLADRLEQIADHAPGVKRATAVVRGKQVVIGIELDQPLDSRSVQAVEQKVRADAGAIIPSYNVHVTSDKQLVSQIRTMNRYVSNGSGEAWAQRFTRVVRDIERSHSDSFY